MIVKPACVNPEALPTKQIPWTNSGGQGPKPASEFNARAPTTSRVSKKELGMICYR